MEGLHPLLYGLIPLCRTNNALGETGMRPSEGSTRLPLAALSTLLDLLAAVWEINAALYQGKSNERNLDKQVASILEEVRVNYLAGATLYKACERDQDKKPYPTFTRACQLLLPQYGEMADPGRCALYDEGYELMLDKEGGDLMNLAQHITDTSLRLYVPSAKKEGRAHRFENLVRTGIEAIKQNANVDEDELVARVAGTVLKRLERIIEGKGYCPIHGDERLETVQRFAEILVKELFRQRCGGSVSKLTHEENHLADAVYFITYQKVNQYWKDKRAHPETTNEEMQNEEDLATSGV
jgi:CRISPR type I-D-associated protein Csc3/Cas10d